MIDDNTYNVGVNNQEFYDRDWMSQQDNGQFENSVIMPMNNSQLEYWDSQNFPNENFDYGNRRNQGNFPEQNMMGGRQSQDNGNQYDRNQNFVMRENFNGVQNFNQMNQQQQVQSYEDQGVINDNHFEDHWWFATYLYNNGKVKKKGRICSTKGYIATAIAIILLVLLIFFWNYFSKKLLPKAGKALKEVMEKPPLLWISLIGGGLILLACVPFPGLNTSIMLIAFAMEDWILSVIFTLTCQMIASVIVFMVTRYCWRDCFHKRFEQNILYQMILEESKLKPFSFTLMIRFVEILESIKNVMIALGPVKFQTFILTNLVYNCTQSCLYCYIGVNLGNINDLIGGKSFSKKTAKEKRTAIFTYAMLAISGAIMIYILCYTKKRIKKFKKKKKNREIHKIRNHLIQNNINPQMAMNHQWNDNYVANFPNQNLNSPEGGGGFRKSQEEWGAQELSTMDKNYVYRDEAVEIDREISDFDDLGVRDSRDNGQDIHGYEDVGNPSLRGLTPFE